MNIISYNINGIRAASKKGLLDFIRIENPSIIGFQEIKANTEQFDVQEFENLGYHSFWFSAEKKGYSGVGLLSKENPTEVIYGINNPLFDAEGRVIIAKYSRFWILNIYFPSGSSGVLRQAIKMEFLDYIYHFIDELKQQQPNLIVMGDFNICHTEIDIHDPKSNKNSSGFLPEERAWMSAFFKNGFIDTFRYKNPDALNHYTWWSYRANARAKNKGWRIDYISTSENIKNQIESASILTNQYHSDHCPIKLVLK